MTSLYRDLRHSLRGFARRPGWTALAVLTLAVGIGANTALFAYLSSMLWPTVDAPEPQRIAWFAGSNTPDDPPDWGFTSLPDLRDYQARNEVFAELAGGTVFNASVTLEDDAVLHGWGTAVTGDYFALFAKKPQLGRFLGPQDDRPDAPPAVVLSHLFWQRATGGDPGVLGRVVHLDGHLPFTVVGVAPPQFQGQGMTTSFYAPMAQVGPLFRTLDDRREAQVWGLGRLEDGVTFEQAQAAMEAVARGLDERYPRDEERVVLVRPVTAEVGGEAVAGWKLQSKVLMGVVAVFLLLAAVNVANLLLARAVTRRREIGMRLALGARRLDLARRVAVESVLLALAGGAVGLGLGWAGVRVLNASLSVIPFGLGDLGDGSVLFQFDRRTAAFGLAAALVAALLFALAPLVYGWRQDLVTLLKTSGGGGDAGRRVGPRQLLVVAQVALAVMLLAGAGLLVRTFQGLRQVDPGFATDDLFVAAFYLPDPLPGGDTPRIAFYQDVVERARTLPGVRSAGLVDALPFSGLPLSEAEVDLPDGDTLKIERTVVDPGYLGTLGVPVVAGRAFDDGDREDAAPVALVNATLAERFAGGALGQLVDLPAGRGEDAVTVEVVGVVADVRNRSLHQAPSPVLYVPFAQRPRARMILALRTAAGAPSPAVALERLLREEHPSAALVEMASFEEQIRHSLSQQRISADVSLAVGFLGLLLASVGLGGVMSYAVARRGPEIGLRMALGADARRVVRMVLGEAARLLSWGVALGVAAAIAGGRVLEGLLYGLVGSADPVTLLAVPLVLTLAGVTAAWLPARRASRVDPASVLRDE